MPVAIDEWLLQDETFAPQMAYRDDLIANRRPAVFQCDEGAAAAAAELRDVLISELPAKPGYRVANDHLVRPDGRLVDPWGDHPLVGAARLVQEDLCLLQRAGDAHVLVGGVVCFPARWTLAEKMGRTLLSLHAPVDAYDDDLDRRVERMFAHIRPETPLMRGNFLIFTDPDLHQPAREGARAPLDPHAPRFVRVARQTLRRLPRTSALVFAIHSCLLRAADLSETELHELALKRPHVLPAT